MNLRLPLDDGQSSEHDQVQELKGIQQQALAVARKLEAFAKLKPTRPTAIKELEKALATLPPDQTLTDALAAIRDGAQRLVTSDRETRGAAFQRAEADYIRGVREAKASVREIQQGWRIDLFAMVLRRSSAEVRLQYDLEPLLDWSPITSAKALEDFIARGRSLLERAEISRELLVEALWQAYSYLRITSKSESGLVPINDLFPELRVALLRRDLRPRADKVVPQQSLPRWAFLYNLDLYRRLGTSVPEDRRLQFVTGSQRDTQKMGVTLNGLRAEDDYKIYCYAQAMKA